MRIIHLGTTDFYSEFEENLTTIGMFLRTYLGEKTYYEWIEKTWDFWILSQDIYQENFVDVLIENNLYLP